MMSEADRNIAPTDRLVRHPGRVIGLAVLLAILLVGDLGSKWWAFNVLPDEPVAVGQNTNPHLPCPTSEPRTVIHNVLELTLVENRGAVFGLGEGQRWILIGVTAIAVMAVTCVLLLTERRRWFLHLCFVLILAGAIGNLYDRAMYGVVRDMIHLLPGVDLPFGWSWPGDQRAAYPWVFNVADMYLNAGIWPLVIGTLFQRKPKAPKPVSTDPS